MAKEKYTKTPLTTAQQVDLLRQRGLIIDDPGRAEYYLNRISYYRLSGYALPFEKPANPGQRSHEFKPDTTFETILDLYVFDRKLRTLVMDAMERVEVAIRSQMCLYMANEYSDGWWHLNSAHFKTKFDHAEFVSHCDDQLSRTHEVFIKHYFEKYDDPPTPPSWMTLELLTMGRASILYMNIRKSGDKNKISRVFGVHYKVLASWLHSMSYLRNLCAHHSRLWNRTFTITPKVLVHHPISERTQRRFVAQAAILVDLLRATAPGSIWSTRLYELFLQHPQVDIRRMGFDNGWQLQGFWGVKAPRWRSAKAALELLVTSGKPPR